MRRLILVSVWISTCFTLTMGQGVVGEWSGALTIQNTSLRLVLYISQTDKGYSATMDSPDQGARGLKMSHVTFEDSVLTVELRIAGMKYTGELHGNTLEGTFTQAGQSLPLVLTRNVQADLSKHTQAVDAKASYTDTPIVLETKSGTLYGTRTEPKGFKKGKVALIVAGSGPTDRDGNNPSMTCDAYKKIAHALADANIASVRYDKRGIAESAAAVERESDLLFDHYVWDAAEWIRLLKSDKRYSEVIVIGHSEGSLIGMLAVHQGKADKFISISGIGRKASDLLKEQLNAQGEDITRLAYPIIDSLALGFPVNTVTTSLQSIFRPSIHPYLINWFKYDPMVELKKLTIPVLLIQGTHDIQVLENDAHQLLRARPASKLKLIKGMNHVLRTSDIDREKNLATYNNPELPLADELMPAIINFIEKGK